MSNQEILKLSQRANQINNQLKRLWDWVCKAQEFAYYADDNERKLMMKSSYKNIDKLTVQRDLIIAILDGTLPYKEGCTWLNMINRTHF